MSAYRGGMPEAGFTGMLDSAAVPMIFAGWAARFVAARWTGRALRTGALGQKPAGPGPAGFSSVNRLGVREAASRTGRKNSAGAGVWGVTAHFRRKGRSCCWLAAAGGGAGGGGLGGDGTLPAQRPKLLLAGCGRRRSWGRRS